MKGQLKDRLVIGITGSFGSGKTTVARIFKKYGAKVIDLDRLAHRCIRRGSPAYKKIIGLLGKEILNINKQINRKKLANIVFNNKKLLLKLNCIIHPKVIKIVKEKLHSFKKGIVVLDAPLLLEAGLAQIVDILIVVKIDRKIQIERIKKKFSMEEEEILKRIKAQMPLSKKIKMADFVIDNTFSLKKTKRQVNKIIRRLRWRN
ncbi:MAG: dephospho-CoA kinase [Candidatus Omnitrophica bacterium]|nr:dephospho-CoA kinase [Candidatus Omnitrophota bacterium]